MENKTEVDESIESLSDKSNDIEQQITDHVTEEKKKITKIPKGDDFVLKALYEDEDGDALLLIRCLKNRYLYDHIMCVWYYWNDHYWRKDRLDHIVTMVKEVIQQYGEQMNLEKMLYQIADKEERFKDASKHKKHAENLQKRIQKLRTLARKKIIINLAKSGVDGLGITGQGWDNKPMLLGCKNTCFDLETGDCHPGNPDDYLRLISPIKWVSNDAPRDIWEKYLLQMYSNDQEMVDYIQRLLGYGITGLNTEHVFPIFWGSKGRNGKSTLFEILKYVLGNLAYKAPANFIMDRQMQGSSSGPDSVTMGMMGKRIIWFSETNENERLDVAKLKEFSGGDTLSARAPYAKEQIEFELVSLLITLTNKVPRVPHNDPALWSRIHLIPHENSFLDNPDPKDPTQFKVDKTLQKKLKKQAPGILMWLIEGSLLWQAHGLNPPKKILLSTKKYQESQDIFGHFIKECCMVGGVTFREQPKKIYERYKEWCKESGHKAMAKNRVFLEVTERFGEKKKTDGLYYFNGITLANGFDF